MKKYFIGLVCLIMSAGATADDSDALSLADKTAVMQERTGDWQNFVEVAAGQSVLRRDGTTAGNQRLSLDVKYDKALTPHLRLQLSDRLDMNWQNDPNRQNGINTLKEAYLTWQYSESKIVDFGRINERHGVAVAYNPTDYFRTGAIRSVVSIDPVSLKKNRLGSVMIRGQTLWSDGSLMALYSPKIEGTPTNNALSPDFGATNNQNRWLAVVSHKFTDEINPQFLLYGEEHQSPQFGLNLTGLLNDATVAYVEWSGGRTRSNLSQALRTSDDTSFHNRASVGATYTTPDKLSLTLEYEFDGAALEKNQWESLYRNAPAGYGSYRQWSQFVQELPTKQSLLLFATWPDIITVNLDLNLMLRYNPADYSKLSWMEARYHFDKSDIALQWQINSGRAGSEFGAAQQARLWQLLFRYFF